MTITLSPETEADIRELLRLWGWDAGDPLLAEATARAALVNGLRSAIELTRELNALKARGMAFPDGLNGQWSEAIPQSIQDARVFEEPMHERKPEGHP